MDVIEKAAINLQFPGSVCEEQLFAASGVFRNWSLINVKLSRAALPKNGNIVCAGGGTEE